MGRGRYEVGGMGQNVVTWDGHQVGGVMRLSRTRGKSEWGHLAGTSKSNVRPVSTDWRWQSFG